MRTGVQVEWRKQVFVLFAIGLLAVIVREQAAPATCPFPGLRAAPRADAR